MLATVGVMAAVSMGPAAMASAAPAPEFSLAVSPTRLVVDAAQISSDQTFIVANRGSAAVDITVSASGFTSSADGSLQYSADAPYSAANWVTVTPAQFRIEPSAQIPVAVRITMPPAPEPGDHQVALIFLVPATDTDSNISINRGIGTPIYIAVPGPIDSSVSVVDLTAPSFSQGGSVSISTTVRSTGTVHRDFRSTDRLNAQANGTSIAFPDFTVPRGATRTVTTDWDAPFMCVCHVEVAIADADGTTSTRTVRVVVIPIRPLAVSLAVLALLVCGVVLFRRQYRRSVLAAAAAAEGTASREHD